MALTPGNVSDILRNDHLVEGCGSLKTIRVYPTNTLAEAGTHLAHSEIT